MSTKSMVVFVLNRRFFRTRFRGRAGTRRCSDLVRFTATNCTTLLSFDRRREEEWIWKPSEISASRFEIQRTTFLLTMKRWSFVSKERFLRFAESIPIHFE